MAHLVLLFSEMRDVDCSKPLRVRALLTLASRNTYGFNEGDALTEVFSEIKNTQTLHTQPDFQIAKAGVVLPPIAIILTTILTI